MHVMHVMHMFNSNITLLTTRKPWRNQSCFHTLLWEGGVWFCKRV